MITRIEINGFKSFQNFTINLRPFQAFIGPNGVKSNLFEAITLLSSLASNNTVEDALRLCRGEQSELFSAYPDGTRSHRMTFAVEALLGRAVTEASGKPLKVSANRLRYELDLENRMVDGADRVLITREVLAGIPDSGDTWVKEHIPTKNRKAWIVREKRTPYIETEDVKGVTTVFINQDYISGGRESFVAENMTRTALSTALDVRYPTVYAAQQEMINWKMLLLYPALLRSRGAKKGMTSLQVDGSNLAGTLAYIASGDKGLSAVLRDMQGFIPDIKNIAVKPLSGREEAVVELEMSDGSRFSSGVLSDGTLRLLALSTLKNDPRQHGVLCFEEPENGVQPQRLKQIVDVLFALTTDFDTQDPERGLRQVLINTHSPGLLASVPSDSLFYVGMKMQAKGRETHIVPVRPVLFADSNDAFYTWEQVRQYLDADPLNKKRAELGL